VLAGGVFTRIEALNAIVQLAVIRFTIFFLRNFIHVDF
jgi:hypothetical protein